MAANYKSSTRTVAGPSDADLGAGATGTAVREDIQTLDDVINFVRDKAHENPEKFALYCLGVGFILGWKLKPW